MRKRLQELLAHTQLEEVARAADGRSRGHTDGRPDGPSKHSDKAADQCPERGPDGPFGASLLRRDPVFGVIDNRRTIKRDASVKVEFLERLHALGDQ